MDPFAGNNQYPQSLHKYLYANGNPILYSDPSGRFGIAVSIVIGLGITALLYGIGMNLFHYSLRKSNKTGTCGPPVRGALGTLLSGLQSTYAGWLATPELEEDEYCDSMVGLRGWDIKHLYEGYIHGTGDCYYTATVNGNCYSSYEINYFLWGAMNKICGNSLGYATRYARMYSTYLAPWVSWFGRRGDERRDQRRVSDSYEGTAASKVDWTKVGFTGNYGLLRPDRSEFQTCKPCVSSNPWPKLGFQWGNYKDQYILNPTY
ncbi:MAG: hypothetical protein ACYS9Y_09710 [Planctomycetota bacterium]|jgi:hypothetical protein